MRPPPALLHRLWPQLVAVLGGLLVLAVGLALAGYPPLPALAAMWGGAFGSTDAILSALLPRAIPLILVGLGIGLAFEAGAFNIGAEGQFAAGAIAATWIGLHLATWPGLLAKPVVLLAAMAAGALWVTVAAFLRLRFGVLEVISTLLLNFVAEAMVSWMVLGPLQEARRVYPQSDPLPLSARLPQLPGTRLHAGLVLALILAVGLWLLRERTLAGLRLRAVGLNAAAARLLGRIRPQWSFAAALIGSGAVAGLAGGAEVSGTTFALFQTLSPGYGFTGIAVALLARLHPLGIVATGLLFAAIEAGAGAMQRETGVPAVAVYVVEAVVILTVALADAATTRREGRDGVA